MGQCVSLCPGIWMETSSLLCQRNYPPSNTCSWCKCVSVFCLSASLVSLCRSTQWTYAVYTVLSETWATTRSPLWPTRPSLTWANSQLCKLTSLRQEDENRWIGYGCICNYFNIAESWATTPCVVSPKWPSVDCTLSDCCEFIFIFQMHADISVCSSSV